MSKIEIVTYVAGEFDYELKDQTISAIVERSNDESKDLLIPIYDEDGSITKFLKRANVPAKTAKGHSSYKKTK